MIPVGPSLSHVQSLSLSHHLQPGCYSPESTCWDASNQNTWRDIIFQARLTISDIHVTLMHKGLRINHHGLHGLVSYSDTGLSYCQDSLQA